MCTNEQQNQVEGTEQNIGCRRNRNGGKKQKIKLLLMASYSVRLQLERLGPNATGAASCLMVLRILCDEPITGLKITAQNGGTTVIIFIQIHDLSQHLILRLLI